MKSATADELPRSSAARYQNPSQTRKLSLALRSTLRGIRPKEIKPWRISSVTYIELAQGCRNQQELKQVKQGLLAADTEVIQIPDQ
ncbi:MAG: hypothetical protein Q7J38_16465 [Gallionella sp.]|nr:hypothetical protein [Gallionella sp.]